MKKWTYKEKEATPPKEAIGFVYKIIHIPTQKYYIGKKLLYSTRNVKIGKRELTRIKADRKENSIPGRAPSKKQIIKESDWKEYYSSNKWIKGEVQKGNASHFSREILHWCTTKKELSYMEVKLQFLYNVLEDPNSLNENILGKFFK